MPRHLRFTAALLFGCTVVVSFAKEPEFESVATVKEHLEQKAGVHIRTDKGWTVADDPETMALWTFTTEGHEAHPAVFMRKVVQAEGSIYLKTWGLCEAEKDPCDALSAEFEELNDSIRTHMRR